MLASSRGPCDGANLRADAKHRPLRRLRRPGRVVAGPGAAPLRRLRRHLPLQGRLCGALPLERLPCKGSWMRRKAQTEGCIAALRREISCKAWQNPALCFVGDDACIVPWSLAMAQTCGPMQSIGPYAGAAAARKDNGRARRRTPPPPAAAPPLAGEALWATATWNGSPARGCGVERRLRRRKRDGAGAAVAECKHASAMMRVPQTGNAPQGAA